MLLAWLYEAVFLLKVFFLTVLRGGYCRSFIWMSVLCDSAVKQVGGNDKYEEKEGEIWSWACVYDWGPIHAGWGLHTQMRIRPLSETNGYWSGRWRLIELHPLMVSCSLKAAESVSEQTLKPNSEQSRFLLSSCHFGMEGYKWLQCYVLHRFCI